MFNLCTWFLMRKPGQKVFTDKELSNNTAKVLKSFKREKDGPVEFHEMLIKFFKKSPTDYFTACKILLSERTYNQIIT